MKPNFYLLLLILLAFWLRVYRVGVPVLKEDEFDTVRAAVYVNRCRNDAAACRHQPTSLKNRLLTLVTNNETRPNLMAEIYLWDFIKDAPREVHHSRAWPFVYMTAWVQRLLGETEFSARLPAVIWGSLLIPIGFIAARHFSGSAATALIYALALAAAYPLVDISRFSRMYSAFITLFLLAVYLWHRLLAAKRFRFWPAVATGLVTALAYWHQPLTLLLVIGVYVYGLFRSGRWFGILSAGLVILIWADNFFGADFFHTHFLGWARPPHWYYLTFPLWLGGLVLALSRQWYLLTITGVYLLVLIFFTDRAPAAAYVLALWPVILLGLVSWKRRLAWLVLAVVLLQLGLKVNYLYRGRDGRAQIPEAYSVIKTNFSPGDKIYAVQLRDYYLADLPPDTEVIDLQKNPEAEFSGTGYVVWEEEKTGHLNPVIREYVQSNFTYLGSHGVEIYSFGK